MKEDSQPCLFNFQVPKLFNIAERNGSLPDLLYFSFERTGSQLEVEVVIFCLENSDIFAGSLGFVQRGSSGNQLFRLLLLRSLPCSEVVSDLQQLSFSRLELIVPGKPFCIYFLLLFEKRIFLLCQCLLFLTRCYIDQIVF